MSKGVPVQKPEAIKRRWLPRFTLGTLLLFVCFITSGGGLCWRREPWVKIKDFYGYSKLDISKDKKYGLERNPKANGELYDMFGNTIANFRDLGSHRGDVHASFLADGRIFSSGELDKRSLLWEIQNGKVIKVGEQQHFGYPSPNGTQYVAFVGNALKCFDIESGREQFVIPLKSTPTFVPRYSPGGEFIYTGENKIKAWRMKNGELIKSLSISPANSVRSTKFLPQTFVGAFRIQEESDEFKSSASVIDFDLASGNAIIRVRNAIIRSRFTEFTTKLLNLNTGQELKLPAGYTPIKFSSDESLVWAKTIEGFCLLDIRSNKPKLKMSGRAGEVAVDAFLSKDGSRFYGDGKYRGIIWDVDTGCRLHEFPTNEWELQHFQVYPDAFRLIIDNSIWLRRRPEGWYGIAWLWEFWGVVLFGAALLWSLRLDWKRFRALKKNVVVRPDGG